MSDPVERIYVIFRRVAGRNATKDPLGVIVPSDTIEGFMVRQYVIGNNRIHFSPVDFPDSWYDYMFASVEEALMALRMKYGDRGNLRVFLAGRFFSLSLATNKCAKISDYSKFDFTGNNMVEIDFG